MAARASSCLALVRLSFSMALRRIWWSVVIDIVLLHVVEDGLNGAN